MILHGNLMLNADEPPMRGWLAINAGRIAELHEGDPPRKADAGDADCIICPGFIDAHVHLPQFDRIGFDGLPLMDWLAQVIYPAESRWANGQWASAQVSDALRRFVECGTLGFAGFLTSHPHAVGCVLEQVRRVPLRCVIGQTLMDRHGPGDLTSQSPQVIRPSAEPRVSISCNPRFAPACTEEMLRTAASLAGSFAMIHTHIAESTRECEIVRKLFAADEHYAGVYDRFGLLGPRTLLAHGVHLSSAEWELIAKRRAVVVHCPSANTFLQSGLFDLRAALEHDVRIALGSDVAGGVDVAMPRVARAMIEVAKLRAMTIDRRAYVPSPAEAWELMTRTNALALGWDDSGRIAAGAAADLLILRVPFEMDRDLPGRLIYTWRDDYIERRVVNGGLLDAEAMTAR